MLAGGGAYLTTPADMYPWSGGSAAKWGERCSNDNSSTGWLQASVDATPEFSKRGSASYRDWCSSALAAMANQLSNLCCEQDEAGCGVDGQLPSSCSIDCASYFKGWINNCQIHTLPSTFQTFASSCAEQSLDALVPTTVALQEGEIHDFGFHAESGVRYVLSVRASGLRATDLYVLPPRATNNSQAVALHSIFQSDKAIGWTCHGSGR